MKKYIFCILYFLFCNGYDRITYTLHRAISKPTLAKNNNKLYKKYNALYNIFIPFWFIKKSYKQMRRHKNVIGMNIYMTKPTQQIISDNGSPLSNFFLYQQNKSKQRKTIDIWKQSNNDVYLSTSFLQNRTNLYNPISQTKVIYHNSSHIGNVSANDIQCTLNRRRFEMGHSPISSPSVMTLEDKNGSTSGVSFEIFKGLNKSNLHTIEYPLWKTTSITPAVVPQKNIRQYNVQNNLVFTQNLSKWNFLQHKFVICKSINNFQRQLRTYIISCIFPLLAFISLNPSIASIYLPNLSWITVSIRIIFTTEIYKNLLFQFLQTSEKNRIKYGMDIINKIQLFLTIINLFTGMDAIKFKNAMLFFVQCIALIPYYTNLHVMKADNFSQNTILNAIRATRFAEIIYFILLTSQYYISKSQS